MTPKPEPIPAAASHDSVPSATLPAALNMMMVGITVPSSEKIARSANP